MKNKIKYLVKTLLDQTAKDDERDDAAMDLGQCDDEECTYQLVLRRAIDLGFVA